MRAEVAQANLPEPIETASRDELIALQIERLKATLGRVYDRVPHYRAKFDAAGVHPDDLRTLADLAKFPFTTKKDLRDNYPFGLFATPIEEVARLHASSGTTGRPTVVGYSLGDLDMWALVMARSLRAAGCRAGMRVHNAFGYGLFTGGMGYHAGAERLGCTVTPVSGGMTERQAQLIADFKPDVVMGTPSYMLAILDQMRRMGLDPRRCSLKIGFFGAEPWTNAMRDELESELGVRAFDLYGLSEVIGPGVACETVEDQATARRSGRTISIPRWSIRRPARRCPKASPANSCSPRSPRRRCRSCAIAPATSPACCRAGRARCGGWRRSPRAPTT